MTSKLQSMSFENYQAWAKLMTWLVNESGLSLEDVYQAVRDAQERKRKADEQREREQRLRDAQMKFAFGGLE